MTLREFASSVVLGLMTAVHQAGIQEHIEDTPLHEPEEVNES